jgi:hypothetical protein
VRSPSPAAFKPEDLDIQGEAQQPERQSLGALYDLLETDNARAERKTTCHA